MEALEGQVAVILVITMLVFRVAHLDKEMRVAVALHLRQVVEAVPVQQVLRATLQVVQVVQVAQVYPYHGYLVHMVRLVLRLVDGSLAAAAETVPKVVHPAVQVVRVAVAEAH